MTVPPGEMSSRFRDLLEQLPKLTVTELSAPPIFTCFPKLPLELRNKIWKHACYQPRDINFPMVLKWQHEGERPSRTIILRSRNPAVLCTTFESREEAKKHYALCYEP